MALFKRHELSPETAKRLPPGQTLTVKWPVLQYGAVPRVNLVTWDFRISGLVEEQVALSWEQLLALPRATRVTSSMVRGWAPTTQVSGMWLG